MFEEGEKLNGVYCVRAGVSKMSKLSPNGKDQIVKLATKGEVMGQRSVIAEEHANLSAVAVSDMEVCFIPKESITTTLQKNPNFTLEVLRHMAHDLKEADDVIVNMRYLSIPGMAPACEKRPPIPPWLNRQEPRCRSMVFRSFQGPSQAFDCSRLKEGR